MDKTFQMVSWGEKKKEKGERFGIVIGKMLLISFFSG